MNHPDDTPRIRDYDMELAASGSAAFDALVDSVTPTDRQRRVLAITNPDGADSTFHDQWRNADLSRVNAAHPTWSDDDLFGDQLPVGQPRFQATPSDAARAKARAKRKRKGK